MKANLMCRTAIGLLIASTTLDSATAQNCDQETLTNELFFSVDFHGEPKPLGKTPIDPCVKPIPLRGKLKELAEIPGKYVLADAGGVLLPHLNVNSRLANSRATGTNSIAIGGAATADGTLAVAIGSEAQAEQPGAIAIGPGAEAMALESLALGHGATVRANALGSTAVGLGSLVQTGANQAMAIGPYTYVDARRGLALGYGARSVAENSVALGAYSSAEESDTVSIGRADDPTSAIDETMLRRLTNLAAGTAETDAVNYGQLQTALSEHSAGSEYWDFNLTGPVANADATNAFAIGSNASAGAPGSIAIGNGAHSQFTDALAIGVNAQTARENQFMFGTAVSNYAMPGLVNPRSRALQTGDLELVTVDENGTLAGDGGVTVSNIRLDLLAHEELLDDLDLRSTHQSTSLANIEQILAGDVARPEDLDALDTRIAQNTTNIASLEQSVAATADLNEDVETLGQTVAGHSTRIAGLESSLAEGVALSEQTVEQLGALDTRVSTNANDIGHNARLIRENRTAIEDNSDGIKRLEADASAGSVRFESLETDMVAHETRMDNIDGSLTLHAENIAANSEGLESTQTAVSENQARIARNQASLVIQGDAISTLQTNYAQLGLSVYGLAETVAHQSQQIETNKSGVAIANALAGSSWLQANEKASLTLNAGYFEGSSALAVSGARRLHNRWSANFAVGTDTTRGEVGARAGLRLGW